MFQEADVDIEVVDITADLLAADFVKRSLQGRSTPIIHDDETGDIIRGYDPIETKKLIERAR
jgi:hypothetical protein